MPAPARGPDWPAPKPAPGTVSAPNLSLVKSAATPALTVGAQSTYALTVTNSGTAAATTARVLDQLPSLAADLRTSTSQFRVA